MKSKKELEMMAREIAKVWWATDDCDGLADAIAESLSRLQDEVLSEIIADNTKSGERK